MAGDDIDPNVEIITDPAQVKDERPTVTLSDCRNKRVKNSSLE